MKPDKRQSSTSVSGNTKNRLFLHAKQMEVYRSRHRFKVVTAGRRWGKTQREQVIGKIMTVRANSVMHPSAEGKKFSLFLPRHIEIRSDKTAADSVQQVIEQFDSAIAA
jgi:hypothetical protein